MHYRTLFKMAGLPSAVLATFSLLAATSWSPDAQATTGTEVASCSVPVPDSPTSSPKSSLHSRSLATLIASAVDIPMMDFTAAESDAAATLFGCDCPACISSLRSLQKSWRQASAMGGEGHCWKNLERRVISPEKITEVMQSLENN